MRLSWLCTLVSLTLATEVSAQGIPNASRGREIAEKLCVTCHIVGTEVEGASVLADVPSFVTIGNKPDQTAEAIAGKIVMPHPPMPQMYLSREQIADLATYIMSLRSPE